MRKNSTNQSPEKAKLYLVIIFMAALYPFSIRIGNDGISVNYIFLLIPLFIIAKQASFFLPPKRFREIIFVYVVIFLIATLYQLSYIEHIDRRIISFILFISMFSYMLINVNGHMTASFKVAIVIISVVFTLRQLSAYLAMGGADLGFAGKSAVGSQRYGFIYIIAFWILIFYKPIKLKGDFIRYIFILTCLSGLLLTFSRSSVVALIGSGVLYFLCNAKMIFKRFATPNSKLIKKLLFLLFVSVVSMIFIFEYLYVTLEFYNSRLFSLIDASGERVYNLVDPEASEGYRLHMLRLILEYVIYNPFTGSGYLGVWIMFDNNSGSAHNQFTDVLFRTGIIGFFAYCFLLFKLISYLFIRDLGLFWGIVGVLIYGLFHETFKESQGAFVLAFLLGMLSSSIRQGGRSDFGTDACEYPGVAKPAILKPQKSS